MRLNEWRARISKSRIALLGAGLLLAGNIFFAGAQWLLISYLARVHGVKALGEYSLALAILAPFYSITYYGLRSMLARDARELLNVEELLRLRLCIFFVASAFFWILVWVMGWDFGAVEVIAFVYFAKFIESISDICYGAMYRSGRPQFHGLSLLLRATSAVFLVYAVAAFNYEKIEAIFFSIIASWAAVLLLHDIYVARIELRNVLRPLSMSELHRFKGLLLTGVPLVFSAVIGAMLFNIPNYALGYFQGSEAVGLYASMFSFSIFLNLIAITVGQAALPGLAAAFVKGNRSEFNFTLIVCVGFVAALSIFAVLVGYFAGMPILQFAFGSSISAQAPIFPIILLMSAPFLVAQILSYAVTALGNYGALAKVNVFATAVAAVAAAPLVIRFSVLGAGGVVLLTGGVQVIGYWLVLRRISVNNELTGDAI
ncbi:oligosaccharide flippase family protein [Variovorax boronicumulans]|uniref:oligosaccharide flippase family protein n=1 Tax=Variovorax boronicumulans TaxID=436515 RepID=UPI001C59AA67